MDTNAITADSSMNSLQVVVGPRVAKYATFTDSIGVARTITLTASGEATVHFSGTDLGATATTDGGLHVTGSNIAIGSISVAGATRRSVMAFTEATPNAAPLSIGALSSDATVGSLIGNVDLAGDIAIAGDLGALRVAGLHGTTFSAASIHTITDSGDSTPNFAITGAIGAVTVGGNLTGNFSATNLDSLHVAGNMTDSVVSLSNRRLRHVNTLGELIVGKALRNTTINSMGNVGSISASRLNHDKFYAGVNLLNGNVGHLPTTSAEFNVPVSIGAINSRFTADTDIAAFDIGPVALGWLETSNQSIPFGIAASHLEALSGKASAANGKFSFGALNTNPAAQSVLTQAGLTATGVDFVVTIL